MAVMIESRKVYRDLTFNEPVIFAGTQGAVLENVACTAGVEFRDECYGNKLFGVVAITRGFVLRPTLRGHCNENHFHACEAMSCQGDGLVIDGADGNFFHGFHAEGNSGYGINIAPTQGSMCNYMAGLWLEDNKADIRISRKASRTKIIGGKAQSSLPICGWGILGYGNRIDLEAGLHELLAYDAWWGIRTLFGRNVPRNR